MFLKFLQNLQENTCARVSFLIRFGLRPATLFKKPAILLKKRLWPRCFPVNFEKFPRISFYKKPPGDCFCLPNSYTSCKILPSVIMHFPKSYKEDVWCLILSDTSSSFSDFWIAFKFWIKEHNSWNKNVSKLSKTTLENLKNFISKVPPLHLTHFQAMFQPLYTPWKHQKTSLMFSGSIDKDHWLKID